jgi:hypothetical protein
MQRMGDNAIRTAHNRVDPQFLDLCDQMGVLVLDIGVMGEVSTTPFHHHPPHS